MPRQLRAMGKRKPSLDMRYLLIMMRAEETAIQPIQAPAVIACTGQPIRYCSLPGNCPRQQLSRRHHTFLQLPDCHAVATEVGANLRA